MAAGYGGGEWWTKPSGAPWLDENAGRAVVVCNRNRNRRRKPLAASAVATQPQIVHRKRRNLSLRKPQAAPPASEPDSKRARRTGRVRMKRVPLSLSGNDAADAEQAILRRVLQDSQLSAAVEESQQLGLQLDWQSDDGQDFAGGRDEEMRERERAAEAAGEQQHEQDNENEDEDEDEKVEEENHGDDSVDPGRQRTKCAAPRSPTHPPPRVTVVSDGDSDSDSDDIFEPSKKVQAKKQRQQRRKRPQQQQQQQQQPQPQPPPQQQQPRPQRQPRRRQRMRLEPPADAEHSDHPDSDPEADAFLPMSPDPSERQMHPPTPRSIARTIDAAAPASVVLFDEGGLRVMLPEFLTKVMRPHQLAGVKFLYSCCAGLSLEEFGGHGCILADGMGMGKTLQAVALAYMCVSRGIPSPVRTMVYQQHFGCSQQSSELRPNASSFELQPCMRICVVCPTTLIFNWEAEFKKWLGDDRLTVSCPQLVGGGDYVRKQIDWFLGINGRKRSKTGSDTSTARRLPAWMRRPQCLVLSYESCRKYAEYMRGSGVHSIDLLIFDEAHRLKNEQTSTRAALTALPCRRRVLMTGTPMQNDLLEYHSVLDFANPGVLGTAEQFRKNYELKILRGREPGASANQRAVTTKRSADLNAKVAPFILQRSNTLLASLLPHKLTQVVCVRPTALQQQLYQKLLRSREVNEVRQGGSTGTQILAVIGLLRQLCNHPKLVYDACMATDRSDVASRLLSAGDFPGDFATATRRPAAAAAATSGAGRSGRPPARAAAATASVVITQQSTVVGAPPRVLAVDSTGKMVLVARADLTAGHQTELKLSSYSSQNFAGRVSLAVPVPAGAGAGRWIRAGECASKPHVYQAFHRRLWPSLAVLLAVIAAV